MSVRLWIFVPMAIFWGYCVLFSWLICTPQVITNFLFNVSPSHRVGWIKDITIPILILTFFIHRTSVSFTILQHSSDPVHSMPCSEEIVRLHAKAARTLELCLISNKFSLAIWSKLNLIALMHSAGTVLSQKNQKFGWLAKVTVMMVLPLPSCFCYYKDLCWDNESN